MPKHNTTAHLTFSAIVLAACLTGCEGCSDSPPGNGGKPPKPIDSESAFDMASLHEPLSADHGPIPWRAAHALALASQLAYEADDEIARQAKAWGFTDVEPIHANSMAAFVASNDDVMVVAFRGTNPGQLSDWLFNIDVAGFPFPPGEVHRGFHDGFTALKKKLNTTIDRQAKPAQKVWATGHSLGGALVINFMLQGLEDSNLNVTGGITFGQPMVVDEQLGRAFRRAHFGRLLRFVNRDDEVPQLPPLWLGYEHVGNYVWLRDDNEVDVEFEKRLYRSKESSDGATDAQPEIAKAPIPNELRPITKDEFEELKRRLKNQPARRSAAAGPDGDKVLYGGLIPWLPNHDIAAYVSRVEKEMNQDGGTGHLGDSDQ